MYLGKHKNVPLETVMSALFSHMDSDSATRMVADLKPQRGHMQASDRAYELYEKLLDGALCDPIIW
ncbi:MAG: hypothetical protein K1W31_04575 [Lachnospiraceae bacterium]